MSLQGPSSEICLVREGLDRGDDALTEVCSGLNVGWKRTLAWWVWWVTYSVTCSVHLDRGGTSEGTYDKCDSRGNFWDERRDFRLHHGSSVHGYDGAESIETLFQ